MRSKTAEWFICKVRYEKMMENGQQKKVTETYVVDAVSFAEAEKRVTKEMSAYISGEFEVTGVQKANFKEIFFDDENTSADRYFKAKLQFLTLDENTDKEKQTRVHYLVHANTLRQAIDNIDKAMGETMMDYVSASLSETPIMDVFEHEKEEETAE